MLRHRVVKNRRAGLLGMLCSGRRGIASIEFALISPIMFSMLAAVFDISKAIILWEQVQHASHLIAISATDISVNPDDSTSLNTQQTQEAMSIVYAEMPWVRAAIETGIRSVTLSSVAFVPITSTSCTQSSQTNCYVPYVAWSTYYKGGNQTGVTPGWSHDTRACGPLQEIGPTDVIPTGKTYLQVLRTKQVTQPDAIILADVKYTYTPFFSKFLTGPITFVATSNWPTRSGTATSSINLQYTTYTGTDITPCTVPTSA